MFHRLPGAISCSIKLCFNGVLGPFSILKYFCCRLFECSVTLHLKPDGYPVTIRGGTSDVNVFFDIFGSNSYELPYKPKSACVIDGGANAGYASVWYARRFPEAMILAVEPDLENLYLLKKNTGSLSNVTIIEGAIWWQRTQLKIANPNAEKWGIQVSESGAGETVQAHTIQDLIQASGCTRIDILKLDIEGAEEQLFGSGQTEWLDLVDSIVIEFHDQPGCPCAATFYQALAGRRFLQNHRGGNLFIRFV